MKISCRLRAFGPLSVGNLRTLIMVSVNRTKKDPSGCYCIFHLYCYAYVQFTRRFQYVDSLNVF